jgi:hypothetical protein
MRCMALLVAVMALLGCAGQQPQGAPAVPAPPAEGNGSSASAGLSECIASCASLGTSPMAEQCRYGCFLNDARGSRDPSSCDPLRAPANASDFYASCLGGVAAASGTTEACGLARTARERDWCTLTAAESIKDPAICANVTDGTIRQACEQAAGSG